MRTCWNMDRAMAANSHRFFHGGIFNKLWFSLKLKDNQTHDKENFAIIHFVPVECI